MRIDKEVAYQEAIRAIRSVLDGETNMLTKMVTINALLRQYLPHYFWVGFYCVHHNALIVGPYQGTLGCLHIPFERGICGRAATTKQTQLVANVHEDPAHIACDSRTNSEIVVPVKDHEGNLIAVLDVDSTAFAAFDEVDQRYLEQIVQEQFEQAPLEMSYSG